MITKVHKLYRCQYPGCKSVEEYRSTDDRAEWAHVCSAHLGYTWYPDSWEQVALEVEVKLSGTTKKTAGRKSN